MSTDTHSWGPGVESFDPTPNKSISSIASGRHQRSLCRVTWTTDNMTLYGHLARSHWDFLSHGNNFHQLPLELHPIRSHPVPSGFSISGVRTFYLVLSYYPIVASPNNVFKNFKSLYIYIYILCFPSPNKNTPRYPHIFNNYPAAGLVVHLLFRRE